jgi:hypothetical protein
VGRRKGVPLGERSCWKQLGTFTFIPIGWKYGVLILDIIYRHDFYQTPTTVIASFFLKKINKNTARVDFAEKTLSLDLPTTDTPPKRYKAVVPLFGPIDEAASTCKVLGTKLEVTFVKADGSSWPVLRSDEQRTGEIIQVGKAGRAM